MVSRLFGSGSCPYLDEVDAARASRMSEKGELIEVSRAPVLFAHPTVVIDGMGIWIIMLVVPDLIRDSDGGGLGWGFIDCLRGFPIW